MDFIDLNTQQEQIKAEINANIATVLAHGHFLALGGDLIAMFAEMMGRVSGCCKGVVGSMHLLDLSSRKIIEKLRQCSKINLNK